MLQVVATNVRDQQMMQLDMADRPFPRHLNSPIAGATSKVKNSGRRRLELVNGQPISEHGQEFEVPYTTGSRDVISEK